MDPRHLPPDFREFLACLNAVGVEYLLILIGGHAVAYHGYPLVTSDMDVWIHRTEENARKTVAAAQRFFGDELEGLAASQFLDPEIVTHFGARPHLIEILNRISGGDFVLAWSRRLQVDYDGVPVNLISLEDLKQNKSASGRSKDRADLDYL